MIFVLDASAMIAFLRDEPGAETVGKILTLVESVCFAHALYLCEVFYDFYRFAGPREAFEAIVDLASIGLIEDSNITSRVWQEAGVLQAQLRRVSLADCFASELSKRVKGTILTADHHEFDVLVEQSICDVRFIR